MIEAVTLVVRGCYVPLNGYDRGGNSCCLGVLRTSNTAKTEVVTGVVRGCYVPLTQL